ncbi:MULTISPECIES: hypothetical protein [unclassified Blastococcus]
MPRVFPLRAAMATGLALGSTVLGLAVAPAALAAPAMPTVSLSSATVAPGAEYTVSGAGCLPRTDGIPVAAVLLPAVDDPQWADALEPEADGSWSMTQTAPTEFGAYEFSVLCDQYDDGFEYANFTVTVTPGGKPVGTLRGTAANTPGVASKSSDTTAKAPAVGETVTRILSGFKPFEKVTVTLHSTPQTIGTFDADGNGVVTVTFAIPAGTPAGDHDLAYDGSMGTYFQEALTISDAAAGPRLADTGASVAVPLALGTGLLVVGGGALIASRRRSPGASQA